MKRFAWILSLILVAGGVLVAQQDMGNLPVSGATYMTGIVDSVGVSTINVRKPSGVVVSVLLDDATVGAFGHQPGSRVRIDYHLNDQNQAVADVIQGVSPASDVESVGTGSAVITDEPAATAEAPEAVPAVDEVPAPAALEPVEAAAAEPIAATADTPSAPAPETLPATASRLPAIALIGGLAMLGALFARRFGTAHH